ncbi:MAG: methionyl-tRNA formyltransferase [Bacilli bacterium]|nr:methionyl-tRNA formyltransferase [Bacilli bacterium]
MKYSEPRILFMGTPEISSVVLNKMIEKGFNVVGVISQPDRPVGRKHIIMPTPTKEVALKYHIPIYQPEKIRKDYDFINEINPDLIITLAYGQILPEALLNIPKFGALNLHGSLLPKYRGAAPIQYALINNEEYTGMSLMEMTKEMDAGKVYATKKLKILEEDNASTLFKKLADVAYDLLEESIEDYINGKLLAEEQDPSLVTFSPTIKKEEEHLDLSKDKEKIYGYIRALSEAPGAYLNSEQGKIKIFKAKIISNDILGEVGEIVKADKGGIYLQTKNGIISLLELQKEGKSKMDYRAFLNGNQSFLHTLLK